MLRVLLHPVDVAVDVGGPVVDVGTLVLDEISIGAGLLVGREDEWQLRVDDVEHVGALTQEAGLVALQHGVVGQGLGGAEGRAPHADVLAAHVVQSLAQVLLIDPCLVESPCGGEAVALSLQAKGKRDVGLRLRHEIEARRRAFLSRGCHGHSRKGQCGEEMS